MLKIIQNEKQPFTINMTSEQLNGLPFDLTGFSDITVCFKAGSVVTTLTESGSRITVVEEKIGQISGALTQAETDAMSIVTSGIIEIAVDFGGGDVRKTQINNAFSVIEKVC